MKFLTNDKKEKKTIPEENLHISVVLVVSDPDTAWSSTAMAAEREIWPDRSVYTIKYYVVR